MKKVFAGGSKTLKSLPPETVPVLSGLLAEGASFLVGDCMGADALLQAFLREKGATDVCVYTVSEGSCALRRRSRSSAVQKTTAGSSQAPISCEAIRSACLRRCGRETSS